MQRRYKPSNICVYSEHVSVTSKGCKEMKNQDLKVKLFHRITPLMPAELLCVYICFAVISGIRKREKQFYRASKLATSHLSHLFCPKLIHPVFLFCKQQEMKNHTNYNQASRNTFVSGNFEWNISYLNRQLINLFIFKQELQRYNQKTSLFFRIQNLEQTQS